MYFSTITNNEIQHFHNQLYANFSMSLTDIISSDLFNVEEIITDSLYRVYPLFYCSDIVSSNNKDKILDNRCLILVKEAHETYLSFGVDSHIILNEDILNVKNIRDSLTDNEFNDLVYRLRKSSGLTGSLNYEENLDITGSYGEYIFGNISDQLRNDEGIIINDKLKQSPLTVKLVNPFFIDANYTLTFTVVSLTGANLFDDNSHDYILHDTFSISLIEDLEVAVPISDYVNDNVILFDVNVSVDFNTPEIRPVNFELTLTSNHEVISYGDSAILTATLTSSDISVSDIDIKIYEDNEYLATITTDNNGEATITVTPSSIKGYIYSAVIYGLKENVNVNVEAKTPIITSVINKTSANYGTNIISTATLTYENNPLTGKDIKVYLDNNLITTLTTDSNGQVTYSNNTLLPNSHTIEFISDSIEGYISVNTSKSVVINKLTPTLSVNRNGSIYYGEYNTFTGTLRYNNIPIPNKAVKIYLDEILVSTVNTDNKGQVRLNRKLPLGHHFIKMVFDGDEIYNNKSNSTSVNIVKHSSTFSNVVIDDENCILTGKLLDGDGNPIANASVRYTYYHNTYNVQSAVDTNSNGEFSNYGTSLPNALKIVLNYDGTDYQEGCSWEWKR